MIRTWWKILPALLIALATMACKDEIDRQGPGANKPFVPAGWVSIAVSCTAPHVKVEVTAWDETGHREHYPPDKDIGVFGFEASVQYTAKAEFHVTVHVWAHGREGKNYKIQVQMFDSQVHGGAVRQYPAQGGSRTFEGGIDMQLSYTRHP
jgi:hypothetical protein